MRCAALCLAALLAAPAVAQDYSYLCATPANYQGGAMYDHEISPAVTCDEIMAHFTSSGSNLAGKDFSSAFSCPAESYLVKLTVDILASYCCGTGDAASQRSACWADYSHVCLDPSSWTPSAEWEAASADNGNTAVSCQQAMHYSTQDGEALLNDDFSSVFDCGGKNAAVVETVNTVAAKCCGTGDAASQRSACWADYSHVCATPANYQGGAAYDHELSQAVTCDQAMDSFTSSGNNLAGKDFSSAFSCPAEGYNVKNTVNIVATYCCGTGDAASRRSGCWADYSYLCADPTRWTPSGEWEAASASNGNTAVSCQQVMEYYTEDGKTLEGDDFSSASTAAESCTGKDPSTIDAVHGAIAAKCCASGNSVCHSDTVDSATLGGRVASAVGVVSVFAVLLGSH